MKLCFSTFASLLVRCKATSTTQVHLVRSLLNALHPKYEGDYSDATISDLVHGKKNVPPTDIACAKECAPPKLVDQLSPVLLLLDNNKKANIVLALKDIISQDTEIADDTQIELVNGMTKAAFCGRDSFVFPDLLAGVLLYILLYTGNSGTKQDAEAITPEYVSAFDGQADISFLTSYSNIEMLNSKAFPLDAHIAAMLAEAEGKCIRCGRPIATDNGAAVNRARILTLPSQVELVVCADCECVIKAMGPEDQAELAERRKSAHSLNSVRDDIAVEKLDGDIEAVLRAVDDLDSDASVLLRLDPLAVDQKITDNRLRQRVRGDVLTLYRSVNDVLDRLSGEHIIAPTKFARQIRRIFEDADGQGLSQREIYDLLVEKLNTASGGQYKTACEVIVSYFVQRCEVFNEIAE